MLALFFFAVAAIVSFIYGYSLRFYILTDIIFYYFLLIPIFFLFLFYRYFKNPYLKFGWTILALGFTALIIFIVACRDIPVLCENKSMEWVFLLTIFLWAISLIFYFLKRKNLGNPGFSRVKIKTLALNSFALARDWAPLFVVLFSYCTLKAIIPVVNPLLFDEQFNSIDYFLFFKNSPTDLIIKWIPVSLLGLLSFGYKFYFFLKMFAFSSIYCLVSDKRVFHKLVIAFSMTYILGLGLYFLFPAQGPIY